MKMISLPNGKFINPAHVKSVDVHAHFWNSKQFYVQIALKNGAAEDIAERFDHKKALALREEYVTMVRDSEVDGYQVGHDEGYEQGRRAGYDAGKSDGQSSGFEAGKTIAWKGFKGRLFEFREELIKEQQNSLAHTPDRRRYLRHSIAAITELIERLSPPYTEC